MLRKLGLSADIIYSQSVRANVDGTYSIDDFSHAKFDTSCDELLKERAEVTGEYRIVATSLKRTCFIMKPVLFNYATSVGNNHIPEL